MYWGFQPRSPCNVPVTLGWQCHWRSWGAGQISVDQKKKGSEEVRNVCRLLFQELSLTDRVVTRAEQKDFGFFLFFVLFFFSQEGIQMKLQDYNFRASTTKIGKELVKWEYSKLWEQKGDWWRWKKSGGLTPRWLLTFPACRYPPLLSLPSCTRDVLPGIWHHSFLS